MIVTNKITMDLIRLGHVPVLEAVQNDRYTRNLELTLRCGGVAWQIPETASAVVRYCKADGKGGEYDTLPDGSQAWRAEGNVLTVALAPQVLTAAGPVQLTVALIDDEKQITTFRVLIHVHRAVNENIGKSEDYYYVIRFLPGPETAEKGQLFRVTAVDSLGRVTAVEAVDALTALSDGEPGEWDIPKVFLTGQIPTDKEDVLAKLHYVSRTEEFSACIKIKCQGSSSMNYPKKNFTIKLYKDEAREEKLKKVFRDWGQKSHKYVLKANYIDHSHARNIISARLWDQVVESREDYGNLPEEMRSAPKNGAVDGFPVKLYTNGTYQGIYTWNIPKDGWMLNMDEENPGHCIMMGANNSFNGRPTPTSCQFRAQYNDLDWETEFPDETSQEIIDSLNRVIAFVMNSTDRVFKRDFEQYIDLQSAIDYRIFADIIAHHDGLGNNMLFFTLDGVKWRFSAYDMDSTFGLWWDGKSYVSAQLAFPAGFQEPENLLFQRLDAVFSWEIQKRYWQLRETVLSYENMVTMFEWFVDTVGQALYQEDLEIYPSIPSGDTNNISQIRSYIRDRLAYCDGIQSEELPEPEVPDETLVHFFDGWEATSEGWVDCVDGVSRFTFTGTPAVSNGVVQFSSASYGASDQALVTEDADTTIAMKIRMVLTDGKTESWLVGTPDWANGIIIGKKYSVFVLDFGVSSAEAGNAGVRTQGYSLWAYAGLPENTRDLMLSTEKLEEFRIFTLKYVQAEQKLYCYADGVLVGVYEKSNILNWFGGIIRLNNEGEAYRSSGEIAFLKIWNRALSDDEILALNG